MGEGARLLMTQRNAAMLLERARIRVDADRVVYDKADGPREKVFNIPHANVAVLLLGQGTSITQSAARLLAEEGVYVAFTGSGGSPLHYGSLTTHAPTRCMHEMYRVATTPLALEAARLAMARRLETILRVSDRAARAAGLSGAPDEIRALVEGVMPSLHLIPSHEKLMTLEGRLTKAFYKAYAQSAGAPDFRRIHAKGDYASPIGVINARLDHGNYIAYGLAGATLWTLGIPASLSVFHGKTRAGGLVYDLADVFKDAIVLPVAFGNHADEGAFRSCLLDLLQDEKILKLCFETMEDILSLGREV